MQTAKCIKETSNWSIIKPEHKFDNPAFSKKQTLEDMSVSSPKLKALLDKIKELDAADLKKHGHMFKHFIYSDVKSPYGAKIIASGLAASGFAHAYGLQKSSRGTSFKLHTNLNNAFATLTSVPFFEKPIGINFRKELLKKFNARPENIHGEKIRIIILDSGFREGIDLFDVKYVHLFEPIMTIADEKQAIGRATRFCGQKGLRFDSRAGWPIEVYRYETEIPKNVAASISSENFSTFFELFMKYSNIDPRKINFANQLEPMVIFGAVDRYLNRNIHNFSVLEEEFPYLDVFEGGSTKLRPFQKMQNLIRSKYIQYAWPPTKIVNGCENTPSTLEFSPTQNFVRNFFTTTSPYKGMLLMHSVGTGKTCCAIAVASSSFEKDNYTIIYVTRHTLKADVWKNMFGQTCSVIIQDMIKKGMTIPESKAQRAKLTEAWLEPMSYKQFSNMLAGKNTVYDELVKRNGKEDVLKNTLVIIDEAHKLFAPDVVGTEKPDTEAIINAIHKSYEVSGKDSARVLLMTATPYTDDPMDMMRLLNICKKDAFPETFDEFAQKYLDVDGKFTDKGKWDFLDGITGYVSYLNRTRDIRSFSYPIFHNIRVPMSQYEFKEHIDKYLSASVFYESLDENTTSKKKDYSKKHAELKAQYIQEYKDRVSKAKSDVADCKSNIKDTIKLVKSTATKLVKDCQKVCVDKLTDEYEELVEDIKEEAKELTKLCGRGDKECKERVKQETKEKIAALKEKLKDDKRQCTIPDDCVKRVRQEEEQGIKTLSENCQEAENHLMALKADNKNQKAIADAHAEKELAKDKQKLEELEKFVSDAKIKRAEAKKLVDLAVKNDKSQLLQLEKCLKTPHLYTKLLKGMSDRGEEVTPSAANSEHTNIYSVYGHGGETIMDFKRRFTIPNDKVLVVFPLCGRFNYLNKICKFTDIFNDSKNAKLFSNPVKYKKNIEDLLGFSIRVYVPGDKCPNMTTNLFLDFEFDKIVLAKSGVYRIGKMPSINRKNLPDATEKRYNLGSDSCFKYSGIIDKPADYTETIHKEVFKGNVYTKANKTRVFSDLKYRQISIKNIMSEVGPGVYYYQGCRAPSNDIKPTQYAKVLDDSANQQKKSKNINDAFKNYLVESSDPDVIEESFKLLVSEYEPENADATREQLHAWIKKLDSKASLIDKLEAFIKVCDGNAVHTKVFKTSTVKGITTISTADKYKVDKHMFVTNVKPIGTIPKNSECDSKFIIAKVKKMKPDSDFSFLKNMSPSEICQHLKT